MQKCDSGLLRVICFLFIVIGCKTEQDPEPEKLLKACFTMPLTALQNAVVNFDGACSENGEIYTWDFGDGETSNIQNPSHAYKVDGEYIVKLRVSMQDKADSVQQKITVNLSNDQQTCVPNYILGGFWPASESDSITFSYADGRLNDFKWYYTKSQVYTNRMQCEYDPLGKLTAFKFYNVTSLDPILEKLISTFYVQYNNYDRPSRIDWVTTDGDSLKTSTFGYDDNGRLTEIVNVIVGHPTKIRYEYDNHGNTSKSFFTYEYMGSNTLGRVNISFDTSLPFYSASPELKMFIEYILQVEPYRFNSKNSQLHTTLDMGANPRWYGDGLPPNVTGILMEHATTLNDKGLITRFRVTNYSMQYFMSGVYFNDVGYTCEK